MICLEREKSTLPLGASFTSLGNQESAPGKSPRADQSHRKEGKLLQRVGWVPVPSGLRSQPGGPAAASQDESRLPGGPRRGPTLKGSDPDPAQNPPGLRIWIRVLTTRGLS